MWQRRIESLAQQQHDFAEKKNNLQKKNPPNNEYKFKRIESNPMNPLARSKSSFKIALAD